MKIHMKGLMIWVTIIVWLGMVHFVHAADVMLTWSASDHIAAFSDPVKSGYRIFKSVDNGVTKIEIGIVGMDKTAFTYIEDTPQKYCYFATAFNQFGESDFSNDACGYVTDITPKPPEDLKALITHIISALEAWLAEVG